MKKRIISCCILSLLLVITARGNIGFKKERIALAAENDVSVSSGVTSEIAMEVNSGRVLHAANEDIKRPMASTTKILTAICAIENSDLSEIVDIKKEYTGIEGSSIYLMLGEKLSVKELLYGLMLRSGNDSAVALACHTGGSIEAFCEIMNATAKRAGALNSNFTNPHGLHDDEHYTTAYDLAKISCYAMKNKTFKEIVATKFIAVGEGESTRYFTNKNKMLSNYEGSTGIKTGFTKKAGRCLVSSAEKSGMEVVCVVLNCGAMFERCAQLSDNAFASYEMTEIFNADTFKKEIKVDGSHKTCALRTDNSFYYPLQKDELKDVRLVIDYPKSIVPPFEKLSIVGQVDIYLKNQLLFSEKIYTIIGVKSKDYSFILKDIFDLWQTI